MRYLLLYLFFVLMVSCGNKNRITIQKQKECKFKISATDTLLVGLPDNNNFEIGPTKPLVISDTIYFLDPYNSKVRAFSIDNCKLFSSISLSNDKKEHWLPWLKDILLFNNKIYVTASNKLYIFTRKLSLVEKINLKTYDNYLFNKTDTSFLVYNPTSSECMVYNSANKIIKKYSEGAKHNFMSLINRPKNYGMKHFDFYFEKNILTDNQDTLYIQEDIQSIIDNYQCTNITYNDEKFIHFKIDFVKKLLTFYVYSIESK